MALHLCRPKHRFPNNPSLLHLFSTSPPDENDNQNPTPYTNRTSFNTFSDVKARLKTQSSSTSTSANEIMKNLSEFRQRTAPPPMGESTSSFSSSSSSSQSSTFSFQEIYRRNHNNEVQPRSTVSFDSIRESLKVMNKNNMYGNRGNTTAGGGESRVSWGGSRIIGGTQELPSSIFGKEIKAKLGEVRVETGGLKTAFLRTYSVEQLGKKLRELRPEGVKSGEGFSLQELNERLLKLRELEKEILRHGVLGQDLRESLYAAQEDEKKTKRPGLFACPLMLLELLLIYVELVIKFSKNDAFLYLFWLLI